MTQEQLLRLIDSAPDEDGYRRSTSPLQFNWKPIQRNKARLMTGEIVEYDEAIEVDPENPGIPSPDGENRQPKYLGIGEIIEVRGSRQSENGRLAHLWEYGLPSPVLMPALYDYDLPLDAGRRTESIDIDPQDPCTGLLKLCRQVSQSPPLTSRGGFCVVC